MGLTPQLLAVAAMVVATALRGTDRRIARHLREAGATTPATAVPVPRRNALTNVRLRRFVHAGAIHETSGAYYIDAEGWRHFRGVRRRRAFTVLAVLLAATAIGWWAGWIRM